MACIGGGSALNDSFWVVMTYHLLCGVELIWMVSHAGMIVPIVVFLLVSVFNMISLSLAKSPELYVEY